MAKFSRYNNQWDSRGNRRSEDELNRLEEEFNQQQQIKTKKNDKISYLRYCGIIPNDISF